MPTKNFLLFIAGDKGRSRSKNKDAILKISTYLGDSIQSIITPHFKQLYRLFRIPLVGIFYPLSTECVKIHNSSDLLTTIFEPTTPKLEAERREDDGKGEGKRIRYTGNEQGLGIGV